MLQRTHTHCAEASKKTAWHTALACGVCVCACMPVCQRACVPATCPHVSGRVTCAQHGMRHTSTSSTLCSRLVVSAEHTPLMERSIESSMEQALECSMECSMECTMECSMGVQCSVRWNVRRSLRWKIRCLMESLIERLTISCILDACARRIMQYYNGARRVHLCVGAWVRACVRALSRA